MSGDGKEVQERREIFHTTFQRKISAMKESLNVTVGFTIDKSGEDVVCSAREEEPGPIKESIGSTRSSYVTCAAAQEATVAECVPIKESIGSTRSSYATCAAALEATVAECVPVAGRRKPGWFDLRRGDILAASERRNEAQSFYVSLDRDDARKEPARQELRACRKEVVKIVDRARNDWICVRCSQLNGDSDACGGHEAYWTACKELMDGLQKPTAPKTLRMRKPDGDLATNDAEKTSRSSRRSM